MIKSLILGYGDTIEKARDNVVENFYKEDGPTTLKLRRINVDEIKV